MSAGPLDEFHWRGFRCHMGVNFTIRELRELEQFCLEQTDQASTSDGKAGLLKLAQNYREAAEQGSNLDSSARAPATSKSAGKPRK